MTSRNWGITSINYPTFSWCSCDHALLIYALSSFLIKIIYSAFWFFFFFFFKNKIFMLDLLYLIMVARTLKHLLSLLLSVDVRTQAMYQLLDPGFIGLIFSCFSEDVNKVCIRWILFTDLCPDNGLILAYVELALVNFRLGESKSLLSSHQMESRITYQDLFPYHLWIEVT